MKVFVHLQYLSICLITNYLLSLSSVVCIGEESSISGDKTTYSMSLSFYSTARGCIGISLLGQLMVEKLVSVRLLWWISLCLIIECRCRIVGLEINPWLFDSEWLTPKPDVCHWCFRNSFVAAGNEKNTPANNKTGQKWKVEGKNVL